MVMKDGDNSVENYKILGEIIKMPCMYHCAVV